MNKLNVKVDDVVRVTLNGQVLAVGKVDKVMPNGRFRLGAASTYWRADGTKNTRARKKEKCERVEMGTQADYELVERWKLSERLKEMSREILGAESSVSIENVGLIDRLLDAFGVEKVTNANPLIIFQSGGIVDNKVIEEVLNVGF